MKKDSEEEERETVDEFEKAYEAEADDQHKDELNFIDNVENEERIVSIDDVTNEVNEPKDTIVQDEVTRLNNMVEDDDEKVFSIITGSSVLEILWERLILRKSL